MIADLPLPIFYVGTSGWTYDHWKGCLYPGRKSTRELRNSGQAQVLFIAESKATLLEQIQHIP